MGLDMYLEAERHYSLESDVAKDIAAAAGTTLMDVVREGSIYLPRWPHSPAEERERSDLIVEIAELVPMSTTESYGSMLFVSEGELVVSVTCGYWRKANAVHAWFVDHCQGGVDECQRTPVSAEQIALLHSHCSQALAFYNAGDLVKARETMPPRAGFFFGGTDVDEWWAEDMAFTIEMVERVIKNAATIPGRIDFSYSSSW